MGFIEMVATGTDGVSIVQRHEAPKDEQGRTACAFLKPSGATKVNPIVAMTKELGGNVEAVLKTHPGIDGEGNEYVSDQRWIFELAEAAELEKSAPDRLVRVGS